MEATRRSTNDRPTLSLKWFGKFLRKSGLSRRIRSVNSDAKRVPLFRLNDSIDELL
jgi:hypothetical protein